MYTYSELRTIEDMRENKRAEIREQLATIEAKRDDAATSMRMAATAKDKKAYLTAENEQRALDAQMDVLREKLADPIPVDRENILAVWRDYATEYNQDFDKKMAAYKAARHKAAQLYLDLAKAQGAALAERNYFARMLGGDPTQLFVGLADVPDMVRLHMLENGHETRAEAYTGGEAQVETLCYILTGDLPREAFAGMKQIIDSRIEAGVSAVPDRAMALAFGLAI